MEAAGRHRLADTGIALAALAATLGMLAGGGVEEGVGVRDLDALGAALAALATLPLVARRRAPLAVFTFTAAASAVLAGLDYPHGPPIGTTVALYSLALRPEATRAGPRTVAAVVGGLFAVHLAATGVARDEFPTVPILLGLLLWGAAWVAGDRVRDRRLRLRELEERALRAEREAERERRLAAAEERTRIARDLHDSAGHAINVILVQAGAARLLGAKDPDRAREALETIETVARETVDEIDRLVGALRDDGAARGGIEPPAGLAALETLLERQRAAGLDVELRVRGERRAPAPGVDQAAYRILQEALTNAVRHGEGSAEVELAFGPHTLELTVTNPTRAGSAPAHAGHGIVGMRERAAHLGGSLAAGADDGRFRVRAELPYGVVRT